MTTLYDTDNWPRMPYILRLGDDFTTVQQALEFALAHNYRVHTSYDEGDKFKELFATGDNAANPTWFTKPFFSDTTPGGNDAINCYWQFNRDDDIIHPITATGSSDGDGMGRMYAETIEANQQICWFTFGVAEFNNPATFYLDAIDRKLSIIMRNGGGLLSEIGSLLGSTIGLIVTVPLMPFIWISKLTAWSLTSKVTKYYDFKQTMVLYYEMVNSILTQLSVNIGLYGSKYTGVTSANQGYMPTFMKKAGGAPDIFAIIQQKSKRADPNYTIKTTEGRLQELNGVKGWFESFISGLAPQALGAGDYVGFRVEKSVDSSESFSNQTGESSIASTLNGATSSAMDTNFATGGWAQGIKDVLSGATDVFGLGGATSVLMGDAFIDIPEVWKGSGFNKSYSISFQLRSPYGDPISIMQSIYLPLALILAGTLPRAAGKNSYTSPFLCRCYCKGMFAIPLGIIESLSIKRGSSEFGWNNANLPIAVDVNLSIKDLSPAMYMSLGTDSWSEVFNQNSSFQEYMLTLSGMGLQDRVLYFKNFMRKMKIWAEIRKSTSTIGLLLGQGSPYYWSTWLGHSRLARTIGQVFPSQNPVN